MNITATRHNWWGNQWGKTKRKNKTQTLRKWLKMQCGVWKE